MSSAGTTLHTNHGANSWTAELGSRWAQARNLQPTELLASAQWYLTR